MKKLISLAALSSGTVSLLLLPMFVSANDKVSICHFTGSDTNPVVEITVSIDSLPAHFGQGDVLVPVDGCSSVVVGQT